MFHLTEDNPPPHRPDPSQQTDHLNRFSSSSHHFLHLCANSTLLLLSCTPHLLIFLLLLLLLLKAVQPPWVILTWWIIKTSETLAPSGNGGLVVEEERGGRWSDTLLNIAWGGVLWAGLWATAIHPSLTHTHAIICFHRPGNNSLGPRSQHGCHVFLFFSWNTWHSGAVVAARLIARKAV